MTEHIDTIVIGAGVVGLACARAIANTGKEVIIIEAEKAIAMGTSSRNSEVIHAGIYYAPNSLKARLCVTGKELLYSYCEERGVPFERLGKLIVATNDAQVAALSNIQKKASQNGVHDLVKLNESQVKDIEPALNAKAALLSPSTGILDTHAFMISLLGDAENAGAILALNSTVSGGRFDKGLITLEVEGEQPMTLSCNTLINSAGLNAIPLARRMDGLNQNLIPKDYYCKGNYFSLTGKSPFSHLIYPVPEEAGLGVHLTLDMGMQARFGPDTQWLKTGDNIDYSVDPKRGDVFYEAIRQYWPDLQDGALSPDYSGVRPKIQKPGETAKDFIIQGPESHGILGFINLFGIESPGLTSSLAIAQEVLKRLELDA